MRELQAEAVSREAFAPFGELIEAGATPADAINAGTSQRFNDLSRIRLVEADAQACVHIYRSAARQGAIELRHLECHPFGSQLFMPLQGQAFVAVVAPAGDRPVPDDVRAFVIDGGRGINLAPGIWHHPLLSLSAGDYLVVERADPVHNLQERLLDTPLQLALPGD
jgi:ureidoglycolate lyase